jgi:hypothetical protein
VCPQAGLYNNAHRYAHRHYRQVDGDGVGGWVRGTQLQDTTRDQGHTKQTAFKVRAAGDNGIEIHLTKHHKRINRIDFGSRYKPSSTSKRSRWSELDEQRLLAYKKGGKSWEWIFGNNCYDASIIRRTIYLDRRESPDGSSGSVYAMFALCGER